MQCTDQRPNSPGQPFLHPAVVMAQVNMSLLDRIIQAVEIAAQNFRTRRTMREMRNLSPRMLEDIGLTHADVEDALAARRTYDSVKILETRRDERAYGK